MAKGMENGLGITADTHRFVASDLKSRPCAGRSDENAEFEPRAARWRELGLPGGAPPPLPPFAAWSLTCGGLLRLRAGLRTLLAALHTESSLPHGLTLTCREGQAKSGGCHDEKQERDADKERRRPDSDGLHGVGRTRVRGLSQNSGAELRAGRRGGGNGVHGQVRGERVADSADQTGRGKQQLTVHE